MAMSRPVARWLLPVPASRPSGSRRRGSPRAAAGSTLQGLPTPAQQPNDDGGTSQPRLRRRPLRALARPSVRAAGCAESSSLRSMVNAAKQARDGFQAGERKIMRFEERLLPRAGVTPGETTSRWPSIVSRRCKASHAPRRRPHTPGTSQPAPRRQEGHCANLKILRYPG